MRKTAVMLAILMMFTTLTGCGKKTESADSYADKLARGEIDPDVEVDKDAAVEDDKAEKDDKKAKKDKAEKTEDKADAADNKKANSDSGEEQPNSGQVNLAVPEDELSRLVDEAENSYESFAIEPITSPDFFLGKKMRMVATIQDHEMTNIYASDIEATFTGSNLTMKFPSADGNRSEQSYHVYTVSDTPITTPGGKQYICVSYGDKELEPGSIDGTISILAQIKMREDIDMGEGAADTYVMLMEVSNSSVYNIMKVEE